MKTTKNGNSSEDVEKAKKWFEKTMQEDLFKKRSNDLEFDRIMLSE